MLKTILYSDVIVAVQFFLNFSIKKVIFTVLVLIKYAEGSPTLANSVTQRLKFQCARKKL